MQKIIFIDKALDVMGGIERVVNTLANNLCSQYEIEVISIYKNRPTPFFKYKKNVKFKALIDIEASKAKKFKHGTIKYYVFKLFEKIYSKLLLMKNIKQACQEITSGDIVVFGRVDSAVLFLPYIDNYKKIIVREAIHLPFHNDKKKKKMKKWFPKKVNTFIMSSDENIDVYRNFFGDSVNCVKIFNPLGIEPKKSNLKNKIVLATGRFDIQKGYDYLIEAWAKICNKYPDWKLRIIGDGYYKPKMVQLIDELNLQNSVELPASTKDIVSQLLDASIYVMTSRYEGYANALVEALACGLPSISYDFVLGVRDILNHDCNGLIVPLVDRYDYFNNINKNCIDIDNLASSIEVLISNPKKRLKFAKEAVKIVESRNKETIIEKWKKTILE